MPEANYDTTFKNNANRQSVATADPMAYNVEAIAKMEREALHERSLGERMSDTITGFIGSIAFVIFHILLFVGWGIVHLNFIPGVAAFDPFPFGILTLMVSPEGVFITIFILIGQNRMSRQSDRRAHLELQVQHSCRTRDDEDAQNAAQIMRAFRSGGIGYRR
jgi:uncharacterized membrane protein